MSATVIGSVNLNGKIVLDITHKVTDKGDAFNYSRQDNGLKLPPVKSIEKFASEGMFGGERFEVKKVKERFDGQLVDTNVEYVQGTADIDVDGRTCRINLEYRPDDLGRYIPLVKGRFLSADGKRGRAAAAPVDEDELF